MSPELSVIIPFLGEHPELSFTIQSIVRDLQGNVDFEIIIVDNECKQCHQQGYIPTKIFEKNNSKYFGKLAETNSWIRVLSYKEKLSHWSCKNTAIAQSESPLLLFIDAHCLVYDGILTQAVRYYQEHEAVLNGSLHLPVKYPFRDNSLIYEFVFDDDLIHYRWQPLPVRPERHFTTDVMSSCGMFISRRILSDLLGNWPVALGSYSGGEHFVNVAQHLVGCTPNIFNMEGLIHFAFPRPYRLEQPDILFNKAVATYIVAGPDYLDRFINYYIENPKGGVSRRVLLNMAKTITSTESIINHRMQLVGRTVQPFETWIAKVKGEK